MKREQFEQLIDELQTMYDMAENCHEANQGINEYYEPVESAAKELVEVAVVAENEKYVQIPMAAFEQLVGTLTGEKK